MRDGRPLRWSDRRWALAQSMLAEAERKNQQAISRKIRSVHGEKLKLVGRGLSRQSWVQCGDDLGLSIPGLDPSVRSATTQAGWRPKNGSGIESSGSSEYSITLSNRMRLLTGGARKPQGLDGASILQSSISSQIADFDHAVRGGYANDLKYIASHFPGMIVK